MEKKYLLQKKQDDFTWETVYRPIDFTEAKYEAQNRSLKDGGRYRVIYESVEVLYDYEATPIKLYDITTPERLAELFGKKSDEKFEWEDGCW